MRHVNHDPDRPVRYAVVGVGYIAQIAALPAFAHSRRAAELVALISDDEVKLQKLSRQYGVQHTATYAGMEECLRAADVEAVYIAVPNHLHHEFTIRAAEMGVHVLCEKPMAVTVNECREMIQACDQAAVKLMIAYRLHFEKANLLAIDIAQSGVLGDVRFFDSVFSMNVTDPDNVRLEAEMGGGTVYDIGIYCINAARNIFRCEPTEVVAFSENNGDPRFSEVDEMTSAIMRFPENRLATFTSSFGASDVSYYRIVGAEGDLVVEPAYEYAMRLKHRLTRNGRTRTRGFPRRDQFAAELIYFARCIRENLEPEPDGNEGLTDVRIIEAIYESARRGQPVHLGALPEQTYPEPEQEIARPPVKEPELIHANSPTSD